MVDRCVSNELADEPLPAKVALFVAEYQKDHNGAQAAIRAGYAPKSAKVTASRLLTRPNVKAAISQQTEQRIAQAAFETGITLERTLLEISRIAYDHGEKPGDRTRALDMLMKHFGAYAKDNEQTVTVKEEAAPLPELARRTAYLLSRGIAANDTSPKPRQAVS